MKERDIPTVGVVDHDAPRLYPSRPSLVQDRPPRQHRRVSHVPEPLGASGVTGLPGGWGGGGIAHSRDLARESDDPQGQLAVAPRSNRRLHTSGSTTATVAKPFGSGHFRPITQQTPDAASV